LPVALRRAHAVVVTHAEGVDADFDSAMLARARSINAALVVAAAAHRWTGLTVLEPSGAERAEPVAWLRDRRVVAVCGIGNPGPFLEQARRAVGADAAGVVRLPDHAAYDAGRVSRIAAAVRGAGAGAVLTTRKDLVKIRPCARALGVPVAAADLGLELSRGDADLRLLVETAGGRVR
jgi:tetraacyldisaccharide-1-P 4'-kinase